MSFLNHLLIIKAKLGDLCIIIIIISFSIFFIFYTMPNNWKIISQNNTFVYVLRQLSITITYNSIMCLMNCVMSTTESEKVCKTFFKKLCAGLVPP